MSGTFPQGEPLPRSSSPSLSNSSALLGSLCRWSVRLSSSQSFLQAHSLSLRILGYRIIWGVEFFLVDRSLQLTLPFLQPILVLLMTLLSPFCVIIARKLRRALRIPFSVLIVLLAIFIYSIPWWLDSALILDGTLSSSCMNSLPRSSSPEASPHRPPRKLRRVPREHSPLHAAGPQLVLHTLLSCLLFDLQLSVHSLTPPQPHLRPRVRHAHFQGLSALSHAR